MSVLSRVLGPLRQAARAFFVQDIALRKGGGGLSVVLEDRGGLEKKRKDTPEDLAQRKEREALALMLQQLAGVLDDGAETRSTLRHLVFVEHAVANKGLRALHKLPLDVLQRALEQLEGVVTNWSPTGLANLRSKMAVAIIDREHMDPEAEADLYRTSMPMEAPEPTAPRAPSGATRVASSDDDALAAAYAALGAASPAAAGLPGANVGATLDLQTELGSPSAKAAARAAARSGGSLPPIKLRDLQS